MSRTTAHLADLFLNIRAKPRSYQGLRYPRVRYSSTMTLSNIQLLEVYFP
jgi:hypothetical protein